MNRQKYGSLAWSWILHRKKFQKVASYVVQETLESFASPDYFRGNRILLNNSIIRMAAKSPFCLPSILLPEAMDQSETPLILKLRPSSVYQGAIHQFWSIIFDDTWRQSKGVKLGISKIANYNSSWLRFWAGLVSWVQFEHRKKGAFNKQSFLMPSIKVFLSIT